jgi:hypothetical protein
MPRNTTIDDIDKPYPLIRADLKRALEKDILIALAGEEGMRLYAPVREGGFWEQAPCVAPAKSLAGALLSTKEAKHLQTLETGTPLATDDAIAQRVAHIAVGEELMARYTALMRAMAADILAGRRRQMYALADAAQAELALSGKRVRQILNDS